jgi:cytoskeletal protein CcmA (bactofilin family)
MVQLRRLKENANTEEIVAFVNILVDALLGNQGGRIALLDDDGDLKNIRGGAVLGTAEPSLKIRSAVGEHILVQHSNGVDTLFEVTDAGGSTIGGNQNIGGDLSIAGDLQVNGSADINVNLNVDGDTTIENTFIDGTLGVTGTADFDSNVNMDANLSVANGDIECNRLSVNTTPTGAYKVRVNGDWRLDSVTTAATAGAVIGYWVINFNGADFKIAIQNV